MRIGIHGHLLDGEKRQVFDSLIYELDSRHILWSIGPDVLADRHAYADHKHKDAKYIQEMDFVITLGGDGTILQAITQIGAAEVPIIGINLGRLGYLASIDVPDIPQVIDSIMRGDYALDCRTMLSFSGDGDLFPDAPFALNDFTLHKRDTSSMITINAFMDGQLLTTYWADGLIVSTPTGSTGYSLSCGGPIIMPRSGNFVITPVAPHNLNVRPIVLSDDSVLSFEINARSSTFMCSLDSRFEVITSHHELRVQKCPFQARLVHVGAFSYLMNIRKKLNWGIDRRNYT